MPLRSIWSDFLKIAHAETGSRVVDTWFKAVSLTRWDKQQKAAYLTVPNAFVKEWVAGHYQAMIKQHLARLLHVSETEMRLVFIESVEEGGADRVSTPVTNGHAEESQVNGATQEHRQTGGAGRPSTAVVTQRTYAKALPLGRAKRPEEVRRFNPAFCFENFVVGPANQLAFSASQAVAGQPGQLYNPLFIYGNSGLGKTFLLHSVAQEILKKYSRARIVYQNADRFVTEFITAIRFNKVSAFEDRYASLDVLLIDDIQFISRKEQTQEIFFHIFNALHESRKQVVFTSDTLPQDIEGLAERLRSRLNGGLIVDIQPPSLETKIAILKKKAELYHVSVPDDVLIRLAEKVPSNIRELEGLLIRVLAFVSLTNKSLSVELVDRVVARTVVEKPVEPSQSDVTTIASTVSRAFGIKESELLCAKRLRKVTLARHVAMYFAKKYTSSSLATIASFFGRRDHTSVLYAISKVEELQKTDADFLEQLATIERNLKFRVA